MSSGLSAAEKELKIARDKISKLNKKAISPIQPNIIQPIPNQPPILEPAPVLPPFNPRDPLPVYPPPPLPVYPFDPLHVHPREPLPVHPREPLPVYRPAPLPVYEFNPLPDPPKPVQPKVPIIEKEKPVPQQKNEDPLPLAKAKYMTLVND